MAARKSTKKAADTKPLGDKAPEEVRVPEEGQGLPSRAAEVETVRVKIVNPSVRVGGKMVAYLVDKPEEARLLSTRFFKPPFGREFTVPKEEFDKAEVPFDFAAAMSDVFPTAASVNHAFWSTGLLAIERGINMTQLKTAVMRAFPQAATVYRALLANQKKGDK